MIAAIYYFAAWVFSFFFFLLKIFEEIMKGFISAEVNKCENHVSLLHETQLCFSQPQLSATCKQDDSRITSFAASARVGL